MTIRLWVFAAVVALASGGAWAETIYIPKGSDLTIGHENRFPASVYYEKDFFKPYDYRLLAFEEESLWQVSKDPNAETYRFFWLPDSNVNGDAVPWMVRIDVDAEGETKISWKQTDGSQVNILGKRTLNETLSLSPKIMEIFYTKFRRSDFWYLDPLREVKRPGYEPDPNRSGAEWILEAAEGGKYHSVHRIKPGQTMERELGEYMTELTGFSRDSLK